MSEKRYIVQDVSERGSSLLDISEAAYNKIEEDKKRENAWREKFKKEHPDAELPHRGEYILCGTLTGLTEEDHRQNRSSHSYGSIPLIAVGVGETVARAKIRKELQDIAEKSWLTEAKTTLLEHRLDTFAQELTGYRKIRGEVHLLRLFPAEDERAKVHGRERLALAYFSPEGQAPQLRNGKIITGYGLEIPPAACEGFEGQYMTRALQGGIAGRYELSKIGDLSILKMAFNDIPGKHGQNGKLTGARLQLRPDRRVE